MKIIVAHPDKQHSFKLATALKKEGLLCCYITTVYDKSNSITKKVKTLLKGRDLKKASSRRCDDLDDKDVIQFCELGNLIIIYLSRFPKLRKLCRYLRRKLSDRFGILVAREAIKKHADIVIMYDSTSLSCFEYLKKNAPEIKRVLDTSIVTGAYMKKTFETQIRISGDTTLREEYGHFWDEKIIKRYNEEICNSDYFLVPSRVVEESVLYCGENKNKIIKVPYGVDIDKFEYKERKKTGGKLKVLFVGQVTYRKGINVLLDAVNRIDEELIETYIVGRYDNNASWYITNKDRDNIHFTGFVTGDAIVKLYQEADIFVLPSFAEGMALVGLEALAVGLPVVCSQFAGIDDLIVDGVNGFVFDIFEKNKLYEILKWFTLNMNKLPGMQNNSRISVENYTWGNYSGNIIKAIKAIAK